MLNAHQAAVSDFPARTTDGPHGLHARDDHSAGMEAGAPSLLSRSRGDEAQTDDQSLLTSAAASSSVTLVPSTQQLALAPPSPAPVLTDWQQHVAEDRLALARRYEDLKAAYDARGETLSWADASSALGCGIRTVWRLITKLWLPADGPQRDYNKLIPPPREGAPSSLQRLGLSDEQIAGLQAVLQGLNLDTESDIAALRVYAKSDRCPEPVANLILAPRRSKHSVPESIRALARVSKPLRDRHRGPRTSALQGLWVPRRVDVLPGDIFSSDDTTAIWGCWVPWIQNEEFPFGIKVMQLQHFPIIDVASQCVIGFTLVARASSSYRGADLWHGVFGNTMRTIGVPRLGWQLERGTWESNLIAGENVEWEQEEEGAPTFKQRLGGLRQLPARLTDWHRARMGEAAAVFPRTLQTWTSFLPKSKSVEGLIHRSQTFEGTIFGSLGRDQMRRPFERAKKVFQACSRKKATEDGRHHFLSLREIVKRLRGIYDHLNNERMEGEVFKGVPFHNFRAATSEHPLDPLPGNQQWLYAREWKVVTITDGWARVRLTHPISGERYSLFYENARIFAGMEGQKVLVYYDRENFEQGAEIISCRTGEWVCSAHYFDRVGCALDGDRTGHEVTKAWRNAVTIAYAALVKHAPSRQLPAEIAARREEAKAGDTVQMSSVPAALPPPIPRPDNSEFRNLLD